MVVSLHSLFTAILKCFIMCKVLCGYILYPYVWLIMTYLHMQVVDCRICGDPNSVLRFAFIEFADDGSRFDTPIVVW